MPQFISSTRRCLIFLATHLYKLLKKNSIKYYIDLLTEEDIIKILNTFNPEEIKESLNKKKRIIKVHLKDWWMREPSEKELKIFWDKHKNL